MSGPFSAIGGFVYVDPLVPMDPQQATTAAMALLHFADVAKAQREVANGEVPDPEVIAAEKRLANRDAQRRRRANAQIKQLTEENAS